MFTQNLFANLIHNITKLIKMTEKPTTYLDKILSYLSTDFNKSFTVQEIQNYLTPMNIFGDNGPVTFGQDSLLDLHNALYYLREQQLVVWNNSDDIKITYKGLIKIKTNSFEREIMDTEINKWLQRAAWILPIIISITALFISLSK